LGIIQNGGNRVNRYRRFISFILIVLLVFSNLQYTYVKTDQLQQAYAVELTDAEIVQADYDWLTEGLVLDGNTATEVMTDLNLPGTGANGSIISWESSDETLVNLDGKVTRPEYTQGNKTAKLTATITLGAESMIKLFDFTILALDMTVTDMVYLDTVWLTPDLIFTPGDYDVSEYEGEFYYYNITKNINLPDTGINGSSIVWTSDDSNVIEVMGTDGIVKRHSYIDGDRYVILTATITNGDASNIKTFEIGVKSLEVTEDELAVIADYDYLADYIVSGGGWAGDIISDLYFPTIGDNGSNISWASGNETWVSSTGKVTRPTFIQGDKDVVITATFSKGTAVKEKQFEFTIMVLEPTDEDVVSIVWEWLSNDLVLNGNNPEDAQIDLDLPKEKSVVVERPDYSPRIATISWSSSNTDVVSTDGTVTRPSIGEGDANVTLIATIEYGSYQATKTFNIIVTETQIFNLALMFNDFSNIGDKLQFNGKSRIIDSHDRDNNSIKAIQFDNDGSLSGGSVFTENKLHLKEDLSFSTAFSFRNIHPDFSKGIGGFIFTLQNRDNTSYGSDKVTPSLNISFDTNYYTSESGSSQETYYNFQQTVAVFYDDIDGVRHDIGWAQVDNDATNDPAAFNTGWVEYDGISNVLEIRFSTDSKRPSDPSLRIENVLLGDILTQDVYPGFMGSMGTVLDKCEISDWYFKNDSAPIDFNTSIFKDASEVTLSADPVGGQSESTITVYVGGADGPVEAMEVVFSTSLGTLDSYTKITDSFGKASVLLTADRVGTAIVRAYTDCGSAADINVIMALTDEDRLNVDNLWLTDEIILNGNLDLHNIKTNLNLPVLGWSGSAISWTSSDEAAVTTNGVVTNPSPTTGDTPVTLTATISIGGLSVQKSFDITVKVLDKDSAAEDSTWLTDEILLNGNINLANVMGSLNLPVIGQYGSAISWTSSNESFQLPNGTIIRPTYTEGDKEVILTATISKNLESKTKIFNITVKALDATDIEAVNIDYSLLTNAIILDENDSLDNVLTDLNLLATGSKDTTIGWTSSNEEVVQPDGSVTRLSFTRGDRTVTLTATISRGIESMTKSFTVVVKCLDQTGVEYLEEELAWLDISRTLGDNLSPFSVKENLIILDKTAKGSMITWESDLPEVISESGVVTRVDFPGGHRSVNLTATITVGAETATKTFEYSVLEMPDIISPEIIATSPENKSSDVLYNTREIILTFSEEITSNFNYYPIHLRSESIYTIARGRLSEDNRKFIIRLTDDMQPGLNEIIVRARAFTDKYGNPLKEDYTLSFNVEEKEINTIEVIASNPEDRQKDISTESVIEFEYNYNDLIKSSAFESILLKLRDGDIIIPSTKVLKGNKVSISLATGVSLKSGAAYELFVPSNAVKDRFNNMSKEKTILFMVQGENLRPYVISKYPEDGQIGVNIKQKLEIDFSEKIKLGSRKIRLMDDKGAEVGVAISIKGTNQDSIAIEPYLELKPNTKYTVVLAYSSVMDTSGNVLGVDDYVFSFTTGSNTLAISNISPTTTDVDKGVGIDSIINIGFTSAVVQGPNYTGVKISDSNGKNIAFDGSILDNKVSLVPGNELNPSETYTVELPAAAFASVDNETNDSMKFKFVTAKKVSLSSFDSFVVKPSNNWLVDRPLDFSADYIKRAFESRGNAVKSYEWSFGDGRSGTGQNIKHTYTRTGKYTAILRIKDNNGISYEVNQTISIGNYNSNEVRMDITPNYTKDFYHSDTYDTNNQGMMLYRATLSYGGKYIPDEEVKLLLYKNGKLIKHLTSATTGRGDVTYWDPEWSNTYSDNGTAFLPFWYRDNDMIGTYELVFLYGEIYGDKLEGKTVRVPVIINDKRSKQNLNIKLYNEDNGEFINYNSGLYIEVDGVEKFAEKRWIDEQNDYFYVIDDVELGWHSIETGPSNTFTVHISDLQEIYHGGVDYNEILRVRGKQPGLASVTSEFTSSENRRDKVFIRGVNIPPLMLEFEGSWDGLKPGYYEIKPSSNRYTFRSYEPRYEYNPSLFLFPGERLLVRMVTSGGIASEWVDAKIAVVPQPSFGDDFNISYVNGEYVVNTPMEMSKLIGGSISVLDDIPMLDKPEGFGIDNDSYNLEGIMDRNFIKLYYGANYAYGKEKKKPKLKSVGYDITGEISGVMFMEYNKSSQQWELYVGVFHIMADGSYHWTKGYMVPVIHVGAIGTLTMGAQVGGSLFVERNDNNDREYSGIIYFEPYVNGDLDVDIKIASLEGYVYGRVASEFHIPTGYVGVTPSVTSYLKASFLFYSQTLVNKKITTHWDNGENKVRRMMSVGGGLLVELEEEAALEPMSRNYIIRESNWLAGREIRASRLMVEAESNPKIKTMQENIFPHTDVKLLQSEDEQWLVWNDDNPDRSATNRTQMKYSVLKDGSWSEPEWIDDDKTADFSPVAATVGNGVLMAWQDIKKEIRDANDLSEFISNAEITVTESVYKDNSSDVPILMLTDDDKFDHSPTIAADGNNAMLVWTKSEGLGFTLGEHMDKYLSPDNSDKLLYSVWNGITWSTPEEIEGALPTVMSSSVYMNKNEGLLLYTLDMDNNQMTNEDQELFARIYDGSTWGEEIQITDNNVSDSNPKAIYSDGEWFITWHQNESIMYKKGLEGIGRTEESLNSVQANYEIAISKGSQPQIALIYREMGEDNSRNLSTSFYDIENDVWSQKISLTDGNGFIRSFSPVFTDDGTLNIAYTQAEMVTEVIDGIEYKNPSDKVDLKMLSYTPIHDLALSTEDGLLLTPENPLPGTIANIITTIRNEGDFAEYATISLYDDDPKTGKMIGQATTKQPIPARSSSEVEIEWIVDMEEKYEYNIYAAVTPEDGVLEEDESNNLIVHRVSTSDIAITSLESENLANEDYLVKAVIANRGSTVLNNVMIELNHNESGKILYTQEIEEISPGQHIYLDILISSKGLNKEKDGIINMTMSAKPTEEIDEFSTDNNIYEFVLEPTLIQINRMNPGNGENQADINDILTLGFNMKVEEGASFGEIILEDDSLNRIDVEKTIVGDTLTVTPINPLSYNTSYMLTIPKGALDDSYGHLMEGKYTLSFSTTASSPEVLFAYPADRMENIASETDIRIKFNQEVQKGPTYSNIVLYGNQSREILTELSIDGEWLNINPSRNLDGNTRYTLMIPKGAFINGNDEALQEDYSLEFVVGNVIDDGIDDHDDYKKEELVEDSDAIKLKYKLSRQVDQEGREIALIEVYDQKITNLESDNKPEAVIDVSVDVLEDKTIQINIDKIVIKQLIDRGAGLKVVTGKGDMFLGIDLLRSVFKDGEDTLTISIAENDKLPADISMVSLGIFDFSIAAGDKPVTEFDPKIILTLPLEMARVDNAKRVISSVYNYSTNSWNPTGGVVDAENSSIEVKTGHFSTYAAFEIIKHFDDVTSSWAKDKVEILASRQLIQGKSDNVFSPEDSITRAEATTMIVRSLYIDLISGKNSFNDVLLDDWFADYVETAFEMGLVNGVGGSRFDPNAEISREQLATIVYNLYRKEFATGEINKFANVFDDRDKISNYAQEAVGFVSNTKIMIGSSNKFDPKRSTTRQEMAVVLYRLLEYVGEI